MPHVQTATLVEVPRSRAANHTVTWLRELGECRAGGLVTDEEFGYQRAEKLDELLQPPRCLWIAAVLGGLAVAAVGAAATGWFTLDWRFTTLVALLSGVWGLTSLGRVFREKFIEIQLRDRMNTFVALLENDLITASELADYEERLVAGNPGIV